MLSICYCYHLTITWCKLRSIYRRAFVWVMINVMHLRQHESILKRNLAVCCASWKMLRNLMMIYVLSAILLFINFDRFRGTFNHLLHLWKMKWTYWFLARQYLEILYFRFCLWVFRYLIQISLFNLLYLLCQLKRFTFSLCPTFVYRAWLLLAIRHLRLWHNRQIKDVLSVKQILL